ncbi:MAG: hypothetical protein AB1898_12505 [Acidobacteriota bacterium]
MLSEEQRQKYEETRAMAKAELDQIEREIEAELARVKERLLQLQQAKKAIKQIYDGACLRLGVNSSTEIPDVSLPELNKTE